MLDLSKFTYKKKNIKWSCIVVALVYNQFVVKLCLKFNYVGPKKILSGHKFF